MNNYCCACGAYLKAPPQPFTIFKLPTSLSLCTILFYPPPTFPFLPSLQKQRTLPNSRRGGGLPRPLPRFSPLSQTPPTPPSPPTPHYPSPRTNSWLPCQRELACGKAHLFQIQSYSAIPATPKSHKPYLPSRLRDRHRQPRHSRHHLR